MASAQVVETSVNTNNSSSQDYTTNPDDHSNHNMVDLSSQFRINGEIGRLPELCEISKTNLPVNSARIYFCILMS